MDVRSIIRHHQPLLRALNSLWTLNVELTTMIEKFRRERRQEYFVDNDLDELAEQERTIITQLSEAMAQQPETLQVQTQPDPGDFQRLSFDKYVDTRLDPIMRQDQFTDYVIRDMPGLGTILFCLKQGSACNYVYKGTPEHEQRWLVYLKISDQDSPQDVYAYLVTINLYYIFADNEPRYFQIHYHRQFDAQDIVSNLNKNQLARWKYVTSFMKRDKPFRTLLTYLWMAKVNVPTELE